MDQTIENSQCCSQVLSHVFYTGEVTPVCLHLIMHNTFDRCLHKDTGSHNRKSHRRFICSVCSTHKPPPHTGNHSHSSMCLLFRGFNRKVVCIVFSFTHTHTHRDYYQTTRMKDKTRMKKEEVNKRQDSRGRLYPMRNLFCTVFFSIRSTCDNRH